MVEPQEPWRSALYPDDWTPDFTGDSGEFLHDFSWAGYHNGETNLVPSGTAESDTEPAAALFEPPSVEWPEFDVVTGFGADPTGETDSTGAIQSAIDSAAVEGGVVRIPAGLYRLDGMLSITHSNTILRGESAETSRLYFTRDTAMTDQANIRFSGSNTLVSDHALAADAANRSHTLHLEDATGLAPGDDIEIGWVITPEFIEDHGMTGTWKAFNGQWVTFFRRTVVAVDTSSTPNVLTIDVPTRYPALLRDSASVHKVSGLIREVGIMDLGLANAVGWDAAWSFDRAHVLGMRHVADGFVSRVRSFNPPSAPTEGHGVEDHLQSGGLIIEACKRVTVATSTMEEAQNRGGGGNGYLFEVRQSSEVLFTGCEARAGRHNFIQNWGFGNTGTVWHECTSQDGEVLVLKDFPVGGTGYSETHHSLATANLVDGGIWDDGFKSVNRHDWSTGAGHTATQSVFWATGGTGRIYSRQFGSGYVIGSRPDIQVVTNLTPEEAEGTAPEDWTEGIGQAETLEPGSLYLDQLARRLAP